MRCLLFADEQDMIPGVGALKTRRHRIFFFSLVHTSK
jgi:hypothetical protein